MSFLLHLNRFIMALGIVHRVNYLLLLPGHHHTVLRGCGWLREHVSAGANHLIECAQRRHRRGAKRVGVGSWVPGGSQHEEPGRTFTIAHNEGKSMPSHPTPTRAF